MKINWGDGTTNNLSFPVKTIIDSTRHKYPVVNKDTVFVRKVTLIDNDTISSTTTDSVLVKRGAPILWGDSGDTLWIAVNGGYKNYYYNVNHSDPNDSIVRYYYCASPDTNGAENSPNDSILILIDDLRINKGFTRYIYAIDKHTIMSDTKKFIVYADSAPPAPVISYRYLGDPTSFTIRWKGVDVKDDSLTKVSVILGHTDNNYTDTLTTGFQSVKVFSPDGIFFNLTFNPQTKGYTSDFYFKVVYRDPRGSVSEKISNLVSYP